MSILARRLVASCLAGISLGIFVARVAAQDLALSTRAPRFLEVISPRGTPVEIDARQNALLRQVVSLDIRNPTVGRLFAEIERQTGLHLGYSRETLPSDRVVMLQAAKITVGAALVSILMDSGLDVLLSPHRQVTLVERVGRHHVRTGAIVGRVTDAKTSQPLSAANIMLKDTKSVTVTDSAGRYRLADVEAGRYTLIARRIGYAKREQSVTIGEGEDTVNIALDPQATRLDELVTTATGRRRRLDVPNDITTIKADSVMQTAPIHSLTDLLESRVPGLTVQRTSGAPGDPARLRLRGAASPLQNNDPIVVVDGIRVYAKQSDARSANLANSGFAAPSPLDYIDPNTIETLEVVKGASAAALYGPDAANGVIVITTKKGHAGPTRWTMSAAHGRSQMPGTYPDLLFRWGHSLYDPQNGFCPLSSSVPCVGDSVLGFQMLNDPALTVLDRGHGTDLSLGASGGTQALTYNVTGSYRDELGLVKLPDYEAARYQSIEGRSAPDWMRRPQQLKSWSATSTVGARLGATADVTLTSMLSRTMQQRSTLEQQLGDLMSTFLDRSSGLYYIPASGISNFPGLSFGTSDYNIASYRSRVTDAATQLATGVNANWRARPWLTVTATTGLNIDQRADENLLPRSRDALYQEHGASTGQLDLGTGTSIQSTVSTVAVAVAPLGRGFKFRFASGVNYTGTSTNDVKLNADDVGCLPYGSNDPTETCTAHTSRIRSNDATFGWYMAPAITNPHFSVDLGLQLNGGSAYGGNVSGLKLPTFPKLGFSYLLSDEPFFPLKSVFQSFRVRAAYGRAGRQPGPADRLRLYRNLNVPDIGDLTTVTTLGNTDLKPERTAEFEGGVDADLLDSRLSIQVSGYRKNTQDALLSTPVPPSVYGPNVFMMRNIGVIRNTGLSLTMDVQLVRSSVLTWSTSVVLSHDRNKVVRLGPGVLPFYTELDPTVQGQGEQEGIRVAAGYPLFGRWSRPVLGYADVNGDKVLQASEIVLGDTAVYMGETVPTSQFTVRPQVTLWHALTITAGLTHVGGVAQKNTVAYSLAPFSRGSNDSTASLAEQLATGIAGRAAASNWIQTVATTRLQDLSVRYAVPLSVARRLGAQQLSVAVQGSNLGLWTNYRGLDPNVNAFATGNNVADTGVLPMPRTWRVQINANY